MSTLHEVAIPKADVSAVEVLAKAIRRRFAAEYKRKILREADAHTEPGAIGAHHLYSNSPILGQAHSTSPSQQVLTLAPPRAV